ncbi:bifunctional folylpolyglutamate synthase/dihydrofolate synthase [Aquimarina agarilytica]|uniref:bifunctional folylpolyglutamate synthase/dihydrofolate synthase n=1 Tax=Aquimarina agarilytica TaxID=1087449 RepID=UPI000288EAF8|nr:folylpolyglutamate synthase/dihydrofolate synthase family protein [Aquimarina agarilytica]
MTYQEAIDWLFVQLPMYQRQGKTAYKADLSNTIKLANHLNNPERKFKSIHVGGTNGKGSTSHMLASILQEAGFKVGLYTSPHLKDFRERIKINGQMIGEESVVDFVKKNHSFFKENQLSFFEMTVGMAFEHFAREKVDIAIVEVGLGGRLDSTNILTPEVSVITNIGLDHTQFLGDTLELIAAEKAGIIKSGIPCVLGATSKETKKVFNEVAQKQRAAIYFAELEQACSYKTDLLGNYQKENTKTALKVVEVLKNNAWDISELAVEKGFLSVVKNTGLQGRWQILNTSPFTVCDTAHNYEGLRVVVDQINKQPKTNLHIVFGVVKDKNLERILPLLPKNANYYFTKPDNPRGFSEKELKEIAFKYDLKGGSYASVKESFEMAKKAAISTDMIYVGGSTFVVAEIL